MPPDISQAEWNKVIAKTEWAKRDAVYEAAMAWEYCDPEFRDVAESNLHVACRAAKEVERG
jgi:hypothetical protein